MKLFTYAEPIYTCNASLICVIGTFSTWSFLAIDVDFDQWIVGGERSEQSRQLAVLPAAGNDLVGNTGKIGESVF